MPGLHRRWHQSWSEIFLNVTKTLLWWNWMFATVRCGDYEHLIGYRLMMPRFKIFIAGNRSYWIKTFRFVRFPTDTVIFRIKVTYVWGSSLFFLQNNIRIHSAVTELSENTIFVHTISRNYLYDEFWYILCRQTLKFVDLRLHWKCPNKLPIRCCLAILNALT